MTDTSALLAAIPKLNGIPIDQPPAFYAEVIEKFTAEGNEEQLLHHIRDLLQNIETFCEDNDITDDQPWFHKSAVLSFMDGANKKNIFSTRKGRALLLQEMDILPYPSDFELKVIRGVKKAAENSFVLRGTGVFAEIVFAQRKVPPIRALRHLIPGLKGIVDGMSPELCQEIIDRYSETREGDLVYERVSSLVGSIKSFYKDDSADERTKTYDYYQPAVLSFVDEGNKQIFTTAQGREALIKYVADATSTPFEYRVLLAVTHAAKTSFVLDGVDVAAEVRFDGVGKRRRSE
jgi:hypothetical protein